MNAEKADYRPLKFLDQLEGNNHIVLLYDKQKYADLIIGRYFLNGLKKGESCIFFTPDKLDTIEERLSAEGIDVESYKHANSLRIHVIERIDTNKVNALGTLRKLREEAVRGMKHPYRFVSRTVADTGSVDGMQLGLGMEQSGHEHFDEFDSSLMCYYDISRIEQSRRDEWIRGLLKNHHHVIYASEPNKAVAFETILLESEE
jgi:hypothetical protein